LKKFLRFMPRRAMMHKYPVVGRFAQAARRRAYLWSFKSEHMRPAFYAGSILSLLPVMGVQLPLALILSLCLRGNFMVMGGLQFITNPFTAAPIYYATHQLGAKIISVSGFGHSIAIVGPSSPPPANDAREPAATEDAAAAETPPPIHWTRRVGTAINALVIGGVVSGAVLGFVLDLVWRFVGPRGRRPRKVLPRPVDSPSTEETRPPR
jgi:uncharacterized protein (DUF2062 family)